MRARNPDRIDPFLKKLGDLWKKYPFLRFGQIVAALEHQAHQDLFYYEDDAVEEMIKKCERMFDGESD